MVELTLILLVVAMLVVVAFKGMHITVNINHIHPAQPVEAPKLPEIPDSEQPNTLGMWEAIQNFLEGEEKNER